MMPHVRPHTAAGRSARILLVLSAALAVAGCEGDAADPAMPASGDGPATTVEMREGLTRDLRQAEADLAQLESSISGHLGDPDATSLRRASDRWREYRQIQCDALRLVFTSGTMGPVAQLTCLVALTDGRREFLEEQYDFAQPAGRSEVADESR